MLPSDDDDDDDDDGHTSALDVLSSMANSENDNSFDRSGDEEEEGYEVDEKDDGREVNKKLDPGGSSFLWQNESLLVQNEYRKERTCRQCHQAGHDSRNCPSLKDRNIQTASGKKRGRPKKKQIVAFTSEIDPKSKYRNIQDSTFLNPVDIIHIPQIRRLSRKMKEEDDNEENDYGAHDRYGNNDNDNDNNGNLNGDYDDINDDNISRRIRSSSFDETKEEMLDIENINACGICGKKVVTFCKNCNQALCFEVMTATICQEVSLARKMGRRFRRSSHLNTSNASDPKSCWEIFHGS